MASCCRKCDSHRTAILYIDGVNKASTSATALLDIYTGSKLFIGTDINNNYAYAGLVDEIKIWNVALAQTEIREKRHLTTTASETNLITYYQFNATTGIEYDLSNGGNNLTLNTNAARTTATTPVGNGISQTLSVTTSGIKNFNNADCQIEFPASGIYPDGEVVVSKITIAPDQNPTGGTPLSSYWIINNYGTNQGFTALTNIKFNNLGSFGTGTASDFKLYLRNANAEGATWGTNIDGADNLTSNNLTFTPPIACMGITSFGQFTINKDASTPPPSVAAAECNVSTVIGKAMSSSNNGDFMLTPSINLNKDNGSNNNEITIMAWVRPAAATQSSYAAIVSCASGVVVNLNLRDNNELGLHWNGDYWSWSTGLTLPANQWSHVALVVSPTNLKIYLNGVAATNTATITAINLANRQWNIGRDRANSSRTFKGLIDEVCFYNRALSQDELREKMHLMKDPTTDASLKGYFQFNETNAVIWNKIDGKFASFSGAATRATSTAPVATGTSQRMNITTGGIKDFTNQNLSLEFPTSGTLPNGEIVVSALSAAPDQNPTTGTPLSNRYWIINNYGSNTTFATLNNLTFNNLGSFATGAATNFKLYKRTSNAEGATWGSSIATATNININNSISFGNGNNITSFSQFALMTEAVLALEILDFNAILKDTKVELSWKLAHIKDVNYYIIERSIDGKNFDFLQQATKNQLFTQDETPQYGVNYYRLKIVENTGAITYSPIRSVNFELPLKVVYTIYPNPTADILNIKFHSEFPQTIDFELVSAIGQIVHTYRLEAKQGNNHLYFRTSLYPTGQYILRIKQGNNITTNKVIIK